PRDRAEELVAGRQPDLVLVGIAGRVGTTARTRRPVEYARRGRPGQAQVLAPDAAEAEGLRVQAPQGAAERLPPVQQHAVSWDGRRRRGLGPADLHDLIEQQGCGFSLRTEPEPAVAAPGQLADQAAAVRQD